MTNVHGAEQEPVKNLPDTSQKPVTKNLQAMVTGKDPRSGK